MGAKKEMLAVGQRVSIVGYNDVVASRVVAKVGARVTLDDGSVWHASKWGGWRPFGVRPKYPRGSNMRGEQPSDAAVIAKAEAEKREEAERRALLRRVVGLGWATVDGLSTDALRQIVALLDAAKGGT